MLLWLLACAGSPSPVALPLALRGDDPSGGSVIGRVESTGRWFGDEVRVALAGPRYRTDGWVPAVVEVDEAGVAWVRFALQTGLGEGDAVLRVQGNEVRLPLGARAGELDVVLAGHPGTGAPVDGESALAATDAAAQAVREESEAWSAGTFLLVESPGEGADAAIGDLRFRGTAPAQIAVYDGFWLAAEPTVADEAAEGPDILLRFEVEPRLRGELSSVRVNVPTRQVVVPLAHAPDPMDRRLYLEPGELTAEQRSVRVAAARAHADAREADHVRAVASALARAAETPEGDCQAVTEVDPSLALQFEGYDVHVVREGGECLVEVEPVVLQHRRRFRGRVGSTGQR